MPMRRSQLLSSVAFAAILFANGISSGRANIIETGTVSPTGLTPGGDVTGQVVTVGGSGVGTLTINGGSGLTADAISVTPSFNGAPGATGQLLVDGLGTRLNLVGGINRFE